MFRKVLGFTLIELLVVITIISISITLAVPSWQRVGQKRRVTDATEQIAAFLVVAQSEAQKRNRPVSLSFNRVDNQNWCMGAVLGASGCDCAETDAGSPQYCVIDGNPNRVEAVSYRSIKLIEATDRQPGGGDSFITFDPVRGILQPNGDRLQFTFESASDDFRLQLTVGPTGLLTICSPDGNKRVGGYASCPA